MAAELVPIDMDSEGGLGGTSAELFGPLAVVLVGYFPAELETFRSFMIAMEADMVKVGVTMHEVTSTLLMTGRCVSSNRLTSCRSSAAIETWTKCYSKYWKPQRLKLYRQAALLTAELHILNHVGLRFSHKCSLNWEREEP